MAEYSRVLGETVKGARLSLKLTQKRVAEQINVDERTILNIEKGTSNPTLDVLYPLFQVLKIDSREIFNAKMPRESEAQYQLCLLAKDCTEEEAALLIPDMESIKNALSKGRKIEDKTKKSLPPWSNREAGSAFSRLAQLLTTIFSFATLIRVSFLHLGQYRGNLTSTVSWYTFV